MNWSKTIDIFVLHMGYHLKMVKTRSSQPFSYVYTMHTMYPYAMNFLNKRAPSAKFTYPFTIICIPLEISPTPWGSKSRLRYSDLSSIFSRIFLFQICINCFIWLSNLFQTIITYKKVLYSGDVKSDHSKSRLFEGRISNDPFSNRQAIAIKPNF